jgi:hypothetical protein
LKPKDYDQPQVRIKNKSKKRPRGRPEYLTPRYCQILNYLWRWKLASTASVHEMINRNSSEYSTYKILFKLERSGFVTTAIDYQGRFSVWTLTKQGFSIVKTHLPELISESFLSANLNHDRLVQSFHLGEWATHQLPEVKFFTRQEIASLDPLDYPSWVPKSKEHNPDGFTQINSFNKIYTFAFEVELIEGRDSKYETILTYYRHSQQLNRVYWLVADPQIKDKILKAKSTVRDESFNYHVFVDLDDLEKNGWDAAIYNERSEKVHTLRENMREICGDKLGECLVSLQGQSSVLVHLNNLKVIGKSKPCAEVKVGTSL